MQTLMLSRDYAPVGVVPWQKAIQLMFLGKAEVIEEYDEEVRSRFLVIKIPAVVRLVNSFRKRKKPVKFSRVNVYGRDGYKCQYCGDKFLSKELTYDHVIPRSRGGKTTWDNIVTCCYQCNATKAGRTPEEARMRLLKKPVQPTAIPSLVIPLSRNSVPEAWRDYLYWTGELDQD